MLTLGKREPEWITLIAPIEGDRKAPRGVRAKFAPVTRKMRRKAARASREVLGGIDITAEGLTDDEIDTMLDAGEAASRALIRIGLLDQERPEWEGLFGADGKPAPVTPENVDLALEDEQFFTAADRLYVLAAADRDREKNGLSASPNGTGEAGTPVKGTASSAARRKTGSAAKSAPTQSRRSQPTKAKGSGRS